MQPFVVGFAAQSCARVRLDGRFTWGDTSLWSVPFISMRGIPSLRYQGDIVFVAEINPRWDVTNRCSLVGFVGSGWVEDSISDFNGSSAEIAGGIGFRYLAARRMGMRFSLDTARGPEDTVVIGSNNETESPLWHADILLKWSVSTAQNIHC